LSQGGILNYVASTPAIPTSFSTDAGTAIPVANLLQILGGEGIDTSAAGNIITITGELATAAANVGLANIGVCAFDSADFAVVNGFVSIAATFGGFQSILTDSGLPAVLPDVTGLVTFIGGNNITTTGGINTVTFDVTGTTASCVQVGNVAGSLTSIGAGLTGELLVGATGADPAFATIAYGNFAFANLTPATSRILSVSNSDNNALSTAELRIAIPAGGADGMVSWEVTGGAGPFYSAGVDNSSAADDWKLTTSSDPSAGVAAITVKNATGAVSFASAYEFPVADGTTNYVMKTDGAGNIDFAEVGTLLTDIANTYFVGKHGNDANDGKTPSNAKLTIQAAVTAAAAGDTVLVYPGVYTETITHAANNVSLISQGVALNVILQQADANVVDVGAFTNIAYTGFTIQCTAATTAINTVKVSTGSIYFRNCILRMVSATNIVAAAQPAIVSITGAGIMTARWCQANYAHTGNCGAGALKAAFLVNTGGDLRLWQCRDITIANSGTALATATIYDQASTGIFSVKNSTVDITDADASIVVGMADVAGTGATDEFYRNTIHVTVGAANAGYGFYIAAAAASVRSIYNHIHVTDAGGASYSFATGATSTLVSQFDDIVAVDGKVIAGTFSECSAESDGNLSVTGLTDNAVVIGGGSSALTVCGPLTDGQLFIGSTGNAPSAATLTAGTNITITNAAGAVTIAAGGGLTYAEETGANKTIVNNYEYGANRGGGVAFALPATAAAGTRFAITGIAGLWSLTQAASQYVCVGSITSTVGVGGSLTATNAGDCITCTCIVADLGWRVTSMMGNITIV
jgi:hypothetical protein